MPRILIKILFLACENSDGLMGFYYSHQGKWKGVSTFEGYTTDRMECANTCMLKGNCVGIHTRETLKTIHCYHYSNRADLVNSNEEMENEHQKAYIKCLGTVVNQRSGK